MICYETLFFFWDGTGGVFDNSFKNTYLQLRQGMERLSTGPPTVGVGKFRVSGWGEGIFTFQHVLFFSVDSWQVSCYFKKKKKTSSFFFSPACLATEKQVG